MRAPKRIEWRMIGRVVILALAAGAVSGAMSEVPSRLEVLYAESFVPVELDADILDVNLPGEYVIVAEQKVLVVAEEMPPPVTRTILMDFAGKAIGLQALQARQRVRVRGLRHSSGQIVALEIKMLK